MRTDKERVAEWFGANLRNARLRAALTQEGLGELARLHRTEVGLLERGSRVPGIDTFLRLVKALEVSPLALLRGMEWEIAGSQFKIEEDRTEKPKNLSSFDPGTAIEAGLLGRIIDLHPKHLPASKWVSEMTAKKPWSREGRAIEVAIRRLIDCGLLLDNGRVVVPTEAALRFDELPF